MSAEVEELAARMARLIETPWPAHNVLPVGWLIALGRCTGQCLTAYGDDCDCAC